MTCEKCIHSCVCETYVTYGGEWHAEKCDHFKPKSRFVELPCKSELYRAASALADMVDQFGYTTTFRSGKE